VAYNIEETCIKKINYSSLPFTSLVFVGENSIVAAGHDNVPVLFCGSSSKDWVLIGKLDNGEYNTSGGKGKKEKNENLAFNKFKQIDSKAQVEGIDTELTTIHQNTIKEIRKMGSWKVSTCALDGKIVLWDLSQTNVERQV